jgi:hypothetical protein
MNAFRASKKRSKPVGLGRLAAKESSKAAEPEQSPLPQSEQAAMERLTLRRTRLGDPKSLKS